MPIRQGDSVKQMIGKVARVNRNVRLVDAKQMRDGMVTVARSELAQLLLSHFRYSLGRQTYITGMCVESLIRHWSILPGQWQTQIQDDIRIAIERGHAGHECDVREWLKILNLPVGQKVTKALSFV